MKRPFLGEHHVRAAGNLLGLGCPLGAFSKVMPPWGNGCLNWVKQSPATCWSCKDTSFLCPSCAVGGQLSSERESGGSVQRLVAAPWAPAHPLPRENCEGDRGVMKKAW